MAVAIHIIAETENIEAAVGMAELRALSVFRCRLSKSCGAWIGKDAFGFTPVHAGWDGKRLCRAFGQYPMSGRMNEMIHS